MTCTRIPGQDGAPDGFLCAGGPEYYIDVMGTRYQFEVHSYCGPMPLNKNLDVRLTPWPRRVWDAVQSWEKGGKRVDEDGLCVWGADVLEFPSRQGDRNDA